VLFKHQNENTGCVYFYSSLSFYLLQLTYISIIYTKIKYQQNFDVRKFLILLNLDDQSLCVENLYIKH
jgi:hypothetical protein